ncbi:MAG: PKD domain-containing protein [Flavobacteriales bacterium]
MKIKSTFLGIAALSLVLVSCKEDPNAEFNTSATMVKVGDVIKFTDNSTAGYNHVWDFGDGEWSRAINPTHVYYDEGSYDVTLQVTDKKGQTVSVSKATTILVSQDSVYTMIEADQSVKNNIIAQLAGQWDLERHTTTNVLGSNAKLFFSSSVEFMADGTIFAEDELRNKSQGNYSVINEEYLNIYFVAVDSDGIQYYVSGTFRIDDLDSRSLKLVQTENYPGGSSSTISVEMSR